MKGEEVSFSLFSQRFSLAGTFLHRRFNKNTGTCRTKPSETPSPPRGRHRLPGSPTRFSGGFPSSPRARGAAIPHRAICEGANSNNNNNNDNNNKAVELFPAWCWGQAARRDRVARGRWGGLGEPRKGGVPARPPRLASPPQAGGGGDGRGCRPAARKAGPGPGRSAASLARGPRRREDGGVLTSLQNVALLFSGQLERVGPGGGAGGSPGAEREGAGVPKRKASFGSQHAGDVLARAGGVKCPDWRPVLPQEGLLAFPSSIT